MRVTEVKVFLVTDDKLRAFVSVVLDECFMVNDIKVIEGRDGRFISMPSRRKRNGKFKDIAHPLNTETRQMLEDEILEEYERVANGEETPSRPRDSEEAAPRRPRRRNRNNAKATPNEAEAPAAAAAVPAAPITDESSLEEVTEKHLSDTFWTS